jgi:cysteine desulfuration protein SufE
MDQQLGDYRDSDTKQSIKMIRDLENEIISEFQQFDDWMDKYNYLIEMGKSLPVIDEKFKTESNLITGCQSKVWLFAIYEGGRIYFKADSDAVITKGIISMLIRVLSGQTPDDIINADMEFIDSIGLKEHLSPTRSNGLSSMIKQMKLYALAFKTKEQFQSS